MGLSFLSKLGRFPPFAGRKFGKRREKGFVLWQKKAEQVLYGCSALVCDAKIMLLRAKCE